MKKFLAIQHTYKGVEIALFNEAIVLQKMYDDKRRASRNFISMLSSLLEQNNCVLGDLAFIAANRGPGPFTTLRVVLASVNGLGFATKLPLIGVDGLDAILEEYRNTDYPVTVALLDAFSGDVYFGVETSALDDRSKGYKNITVLFEELLVLYPNTKMQFIGNGAIKYKKEIESLYKENAILADPMPEQCSVSQIGRMAFGYWKNAEGLTDQLLPIYLKQMAFAKPEKPSSF